MVKQRIQERRRGMNFEPMKIPLVCTSEKTNLLWELTGPHLATWSRYCSLETDDHLPRLPSTPGPETKGVLTDSIGVRMGPVVISWKLSLATSTWHWHLLMPFSVN